MNVTSLARLSFAATIVLATCGVVTANDLASFQGTWEMTGTNAGVPIRVVKIIEENKETVEVYSNGNLTQKHHVEFELRAFGPAKVFVWTKGQITVGPRAGQRLPSGRFIYRIDDKTLVGVHGMLEGDKTSVLREVYKRVGKRPAPPAT